jgi:hypothetical protein
MPPTDSETAVSALCPAIESATAVADLAADGLATIAQRTNHSRGAQAPPPGRAVSGFSDEISCSVPDFLRRTGIGRSHFYDLVGRGEISTFLSDSKRLVLIQSWFDYIARQQAAERDQGGGSPRGVAARRQQKAAR